MVVQDLIKSSLRKLGVIASGEPVPVDMLSDSLEALQVMLRLWASKRLIVYASTRESFSLVSGTTAYTWGTGGTITTARPNAVIGAFVRDSGNQDHPIEIISEGQYRLLQDKSGQGRPSRMFYNPLYPLGYLYAYPTPQDVETVWIDSMKPFTETSSFDSISSTLSFPPNYEEALVYNLGIRIAPEFGKTVSAEVAAIAKDSYEAITTLNSGNQVEPVSLSLPVGGVGTYDINGG
jgi:hypothetical protein